MQSSSFLEYSIFIRSNSLNEVLHPAQIWLTKAGTEKTNHNTTKMKSNTANQHSKPHMECITPNYNQVPCFHWLNNPPMP